MRMPTEQQLRSLSPMMDAASTLKRLGNDVDLFDQIVDIAIEDGPDLLQAARQALGEGDARTLRRSAHSLKSLMATLSAHEAVNAALRLEQCAASEDLSQASDLLQKCGHQVSEVNTALRAYCDGRGKTTSDGQACSSGA
jgi:HPt (histidine-containing phosphotransfer) domain-containing protein